MASLIALLGSLSYIMVLAVINGSVGFVCAMGVTVFGAVGVAKALGETIALSYGWIIGLTIGCGVLRGLLRYFEQYAAGADPRRRFLCNHCILCLRKGRKSRDGDGKPFRLRISCRRTRNER